MGCTVWDSNLGGGKIFHAHPEQPEAHPPSSTMGMGSFPAVQWPGHGIGYSPPFSAKVANGVELYLHLPAVPA